MQSRDALKDVGTSGPASLGLELLKYYRNLEITEAQYFVGNALLVADHIHEYRPRIYTPIPSVARSYALSRIDNQRGYDPELSAQLGVWRYSVYHAMDGNSADLSLMLWSKEKCEAVKMTGKVEILQRAIDRYLTIKSPMDDFELSMRAYALDCLDKQRSKKQSAT